MAETVQVCGIRVFPFESRNALIDFAFGRKGILVAVNAEKAVNADNNLRHIINTNIGYCDGAGTVKACRRKGAPKALRIPGCELWLDIIARYAPQGKRFYLVGSRQEVVEGTVAKLRSQHPGIKIAGFRNGFLNTTQERQQLIDDIARTAPDIVFVAMGSPRQEMLMAEMIERHKALYQGLGGSFDLFMGNFKRAPRLLQRMGCEWLWRFVAQPTRIRRLTPYLKFAGRLYSGRI